MVLQNAVSAMPIAESERLTLPQLIESIQARLPEISQQFRVRDLGLFGSYVRGDERADSDLDVLVDFEGGEEGAPREPLSAFLSELLHVKVDVIPSENLRRRPYFGRNVLRHIVWLQKDDVPQFVTLPPRVFADGDNRDDMEPKREYMDFIQDMLTSMDEALEFGGDLNSGQLLNDRKTLSAVKYAIQTIGEAAGKIPPEVRALYPGIRWGEMMGMRNRLVHDYARVQAEIVWEILHEDLPNDRMLVADMFEREKKRRGLEGV